MRIITTALLLIISTCITAQTNNLRLYQCFVTEDMYDWIVVMSEMEHNLASNPNNDKEFELLHSQYGYIAYLIHQKRLYEANSYIKKAEKHIENLLLLNPNSVETMSTQASIMFLKITISPFQMIHLGYRGISILNKAIELEPNNIYANIEYTHYKHYTPSITNSNINEAIKRYSNAIEILNKQNNNTPPKSWWYMNLYLQLAIAYQKNGNKKMAQSVYEQVLTMEPNCKWALKSIKN